MRENFQGASRFLSANGLPRSPQLMDIVGSWLASLALLTAVISTSIADVNVLSWCMASAVGAIVRAISGSNSVTDNEIVSIGSPS